MCDHCDEVDALLADILGRKATDIVMKRIKAKLHDPKSESELHCTVTR